MTLENTGMDANHSLSPVVALALWTQAVRVLIPWQRVQAARRQVIAIDHFKFGESAQVPPPATIGSSLDLGWTARAAPSGPSELQQRTERLTLFALSNVVLLALWLPLLSRLWPGA